MGWNWGKLRPLALVSAVGHCGLRCGVYQSSGRPYYFYSLLGVVFDPAASHRLDRSSLDISQRGRSHRMRRLVCLWHVSDMAVVARDGRWCGVKLTLWLRQPSSENDPKGEIPSATGEQS